MFQPSGVAVFAITALWLGGTGMIGANTLVLFFIGLPALAVGTWAGLKLFGKLDDRAFRQVVLVFEPGDPWSMNLDGGTSPR